VKLIWTLDHLQALQRMQGEVLPAATGLAREALNG
jgi:hypothetical protein